MSVEEFQKDLKSMSLDDALKKHNMSLQELFNCHQNKGLKQRFKSHSTYICEIRENSYTIQKTRKGFKEHYGTYHNYDDAVRIVRELEKCDWDKSRLYSILDKLNIDSTHLKGNY